MRFGSELDQQDVAILAALKQNARISNKDLAAAVGLAPSTCLERVRRLRGIGAIHGYHADVDLAMLGFGLQALIAVRLNRHSRELVDSFRSYVLGLAEVRAVYHVAGADDFLVHVAVRDADHLRDLAMDAFTTRPEVSHIETRLIFEHMPIRRLPIAEGEWE
ncbi:MAG: Lrp/AsnC family transcriptional regulator [Thermoanaerobaculales bacterium]|jgi:DNA-binding Lrp family transcriptional regulator|nr:Lrp/AsnC family transcriptional regulator [Thermoanaerobaculales bacterium]